jgi:phosphoesterase RecJ-like protein
MDQTPKQQITDLISTSHEILVVSHKNPDGDSLGSLIALKFVLEKLDKKVTMACVDQPTKAFTFLPKVDEIKTKIEASKDFIISLSTERAKVKNLGYKKSTKNNTVEIIITPDEKGEFSESDVKVLPSKPNFDLIIVLDTPNLERLGTLTDSNEIFAEIPVINIDHHPANEKFGQVNWVDLTATSTAEILVSMIEALSRDGQLMNADVATALLTGLIYDTSSFQNINTTPKSLTVAAQLVAAGGRQQEIVKNLYKTKTLETLKLWGIILQNVKEDKIHHFLWSTVTKQEMERVGSDESAIGGILDELLKSATDVDFALLLSEREGQVHGSMRSIAKDINVAEIAKLFAGGGHEVAAAFRIEGTLRDKEDMVLSKIRDFQNNHDVKPFDQGSTEPSEPISVVEEPVIKEQTQPESPVFDAPNDFPEPKPEPEIKESVAKPAVNEFADPFLVPTEPKMSESHTDEPQKQEKKMEIEPEPFVIADQAKLEPSPAPKTEEIQEAFVEKKYEDLETKW